jgi:hypothetical protein
MSGVTLPILPGVEVKARILVDGQLVPAPPPSVSSSLPTSVIEGTRVIVGPQGAVVSVPPPPPPPPPPPAPPLGLVTTGGSITRVQLRSREAFPSFFDNAAASGVTSDVAGAVVFPSVPEGLYSITVAGVPANNYVADIREGSASVYDSGILLGDRPTTIDVIISSGALSIKGVVRDAVGKPAVSANVVVVPAPARRQNPWLYRTFRTNINGEFSLNNVAPGEYKLFAWEVLPNTAYMNAAFLEKFEARGKAANLTPGGEANFDLTLIPFETGR